MCGSGPWSGHGVKSMVGGGSPAPVDKMFGTCENIISIRTV